MTERDDVFFFEEQRFTQPWIWVLVLCVGGGMIALFGRIMYAQLLLGVPVGNQPMSDAALLIVGPLAIAFGAALVLLFVFARLVVVVRAEGIGLRFHPFHRRTHLIARDDIVDVRAVTYRPIVEYGGWGIRYGGGGKAYTVRGDRGVRLELAGGGYVLIGSQRSEDLAAACRTAFGAGYGTPT